MSLPYHREVAYLSPSSLRLFENNPVEFYLQRLGPFETRPPKQPQTVYMAVGSVFDSHVKAQLARDLQLPCPDVGQLLQKTVEVQGEERGHALKLGLELYEFYVACGAYKRLLDEGVHAVELEPANQWVPFTDHALMGRSVSGVPLMGRPDALIKRNDGVRVILDWKVTSANSPNKGYVRSFDKDGQIANSNHLASVCPMEQLNPTWADQLATYHWLTRPRKALGKSFQRAEVAIDQIVYGGKRWRVAQFRTYVSAQRQNELRHRYQTAWWKIQAGEVLSEGDRNLPPSFLALIRR